MKTVRGKSDHVVVVGAGLAGIAAAMRLAAAGREVTVLERESVPGGRAGIWQSDGHLFDTGPTVLTMPNLIAVVAPIALLISCLHTLNRLAGDLHVFRVLSPRLHFSRGRR